MHFKLSTFLVSLLVLFLLFTLTDFKNESAAADSFYNLFLPLIQRDDSEPKILLTDAQTQTFPVPYGYGLTFHYDFSDLYRLPIRVADFVTTQFSPDGGLTWLTDEAQRSPQHDWDNIHGDIACGLTQYNLVSGHTYALRILLTWHDGLGTYQTPSDSISATVSEYDCGDLDNDGIPDALEQGLAEKFFPNLWARWEKSDRQKFYPYLDSYDGTLPFSVTPYLAGVSIQEPELNDSQTDLRYCGGLFQCLEIRYGLAYSHDCGDDPRNECSGINNHLGDSEFYAILVAREGYDQSWGTPWELAKEDVGAWRQVLSYTAAHWGTSTDSSKCHYYMSPRTTPATLFVAEGKHATYHSVRDCDKGGFYGSDYCVDERHGGKNLRNDLNPGELQNIGNSSEHFLYDTNILQPKDLKQDTYELWSGSKFGEAGSFLQKFTTYFPWDEWWFYNSPAGKGCGDLCGCRSGN